MAYTDFDLKNSPQQTGNRTENWDARMDNQREDHPDPERHPQRNCPKLLQCHSVPINDMENTNVTN